MFYKIRLISLFALTIFFGNIISHTNSNSFSSINFNIEYSVPLTYNIENIKHKAPFIERDFVGFKEFIGFFESGSNYDKVNKLGYLGKYQFGVSTLKVLRIEYQNDFINNPAIQEKAFLMNVMRNKWILRREISKFHGLNINDHYISESGIIAAAHLSGPGNVKKFLRSNCNIMLDLQDINGTKISDYIKIFKNYDISNIVAIRKPNLN